HGWGHAAATEKTTPVFRHGSITRTPTWYVDSVIDSRLLLVPDGNRALVNAPFWARPTSPDSSKDRAACQLRPSPSSVDLRSPGADANDTDALPVSRSTSGTFSSPIPPFEWTSL